MEAQTELCLKICFIVCFNVTWQYVNHMKRIVIINLFRSSSSFTLHNCNYSHYVVAEYTFQKSKRKTKTSLQLFLHVLTFASTWRDETALKTWILQTVKLDLGKWNALSAHLLFCSAALLWTVRFPIPFRSFSTFHQLFFGITIKARDVKSQTLEKLTDNCWSSSLEAWYVAIGPANVHCQAMIGTTDGLEFRSGCP